MSLPVVDAGSEVNSWVRWFAENVSKGPSIWVHLEPKYGELMMMSWWRAHTAADEFLDEVGVPYEDEGNFVSRLLWPSTHLWRCTDLLFYSRGPLGCRQARCIVHFHRFVKGLGYAQRQALQRHRVRRLDHQVSFSIFLNWSQTPLCMFSTTLTRCDRWKKKAVPDQLWRSTCSGLCHQLDPRLSQPRPPILHGSLYHHGSPCLLLCRSRWTVRSFLREANRFRWIERRAWWHAPTRHGARRGPHR